MKTAVMVDNLCKRYGSFTALKNLSFEIKRGKCVGLLGPNGAGKSTAIQILTGQLKPLSGSVRIKGMDPVQNPKAVHHIIGYVPESPYVYTDITVEKNIELFRRIYREPKEQTEKIIQKLGLKEKAKTKAKYLSKGLKQRLLLARTLVHTPQVVFLDEPTSGLDPASTHFVCEILEELKQSQTALLLSTHLMYLAERLCDYIVLLNKGEMEEEGTLADIKSRYGTKFMEVKFLEKGEEKTRKVPFDDRFMEELEKVRAMGKILSIHTGEPKLEDIFTRIVRGE